MGAELRSQSKGKLGLPVRPENPEYMNEQGLTAQEVQNSSSKFITCHCYTGNSVKSSSPAHWHREIEIMHFVSGQGFSHTCQCKGESFDAPAIVVVPSNLIHRTCYAPDCKVNRILFKGESLRLHDTDKALENCLSQLRCEEARGSIIIRAQDPGFEELVQALTLIEELGDSDEEQTFDPSKAQEDSIKQDKVDAYVAATFANTGPRACEALSGLPDVPTYDYGDIHEQYAPQPRRGRRPHNQSISERLSAEEYENARGNSLFGTQHENAYNSASAINAGSIAIALAQNFQAGAAIQKTGKNHDNLLEISDLISARKYNAEGDYRHQGLRLQFKAFLLNFLGKMTELGYFSESRAGRKPRTTRYNDEKIKQLLKHIHDNYHRPMNISELARMLQVTNQYFCRYFKQLTDMSFIDYLNDLRLQKAAQEIATTQQSIREISAKHGFDTIGYFFKLFRERYNTTPIGYRSRFMDVNGRSLDSSAPVEPVMDSPSYEPHVVTRRRRRQIVDDENM